MAEVPVDIVAAFNNSEERADISLDAFLQDVCLEDIIPELVRNSTLRAALVSRFAEVVQNLIRISEELHELRAMGHMDFQEGHFECSGNLLEVKKHVLWLKDLRREWRQLQDGMHRAQPLLQLFLPKQQVHLFRVVAKLAWGKREAVQDLLSLLSVVHRVKMEEAQNALDTMPTPDDEDIMTGSVHHLLERSRQSHLTLKMD
eukprot:1027298-Amphidinium_carterae.1